MELNGTYLGFAPTDESGVGVGELEVVIDDNTVTFRHATGLTIEENDGPRSLLREMSAAEIASLFNEGADLSNVTTGYRFGENGPIFLFTDPDPEHPEAAQILLLQLFGADIDEIFGPMVLFTPDQVEAGHFETAIADIEGEQGDPGVVPRLENNGLRS